MLEDKYVKLCYQLIKFASSEMSKRKKKKKKKGWVVFMVLGGIFHLQIVFCSCYLN